MRQRKRKGRPLDGWLIVDKPQGLLVHPNHIEKSGTLTNGLAFHFWKTEGEAIRPGLVHRLDRQFAIKAKEADRTHVMTRLEAVNGDVISHLIARTNPKMLVLSKTDKSYQRHVVRHQAQLELRRRLGADSKSSAQ